MPFISIPSCFSCPTLFFCLRKSRCKHYINGFMGLILLRHILSIDTDTSPSQTLTSSWTLCPVKKVKCELQLVIWNSNGQNADVRNGDPNAGGVLLKKQQRPSFCAIPTFTSSAWLIVSSTSHPSSHLCCMCVSQHGLSHHFPSLLLYISISPLPPSAVSPWPSAACK